MSTKTLVYIGMTVGSILGGYVPVLLWNASVLSYSSVLFSGIGGIVGIVLGLRLGRYLGL